MKTTFRFLAIAAAFFSVLSCTRELENTDKEEAPQSLHYVHFVADAPETKTSLDIPDGGDVVVYSWTDSDECDWKPENGDCRWTIVNKTKSETAKSIFAIMDKDNCLSILAGFESDVTVGDVLYAQYNKSVSSSQTYTPESLYHQESDVMISNEITVQDGENTEYCFSFKREIAFAQMKLKGMTPNGYVSNVTIESDKPIAGLYNRETASFDSETSTTIVLNNVDVQINENGEATVYFAIIPVEDANLTVTVETLNADHEASDTYRKTFARPISFVKGDVRAFGVKLDKVETQVLLYESFNQTTGTGGNDGQWSGLIATNDDVYDNNGWIVENVKGANKCLKVGISKQVGTATSPVLHITTGGAKLWFKAGAWDGTDEKTTINLVIVGNGSITPSKITLKKGAWSEYDCTISGADSDTKVKFSASQASNNRFFLDEVYVYSGSKPKVKKNQIISFPKASYECNVGESFKAPEPDLTGVHTTVTYSSSEEQVAAVDPSTGEVTIKAAGTTIITATAAGTEEYYEKSASYTLTVNKKDQEISFGQSAYEVVLADAGSFASPTVSGAQTDVTYSSSEESVATVDSSTGVVSIQATGTTIIKATAVETDVYNSASAQYTLQVLAASKPKYLKVTSVPEYWTDGQYLIVYESGNTVNILSGEASGGGYGDYSTTTVTTTGVIESSEDVDKCVVTIEKTSNGHSLRLGSNFLGLTSDANKLNFDTRFTAKNYEWNLEISGNNAVIKNAHYTSRVIKWNSGSPRFACYSSGQSAIQIYKLEDKRSSQSLSYSKSSVECYYDERDNVEWPTLSGAVTEVKYSSSNSDVATVNVDGSVEILAAGTTTITATAAATSDYKSASASFTLTVNKKTQTITYNGTEGTMDLYKDGKPASLPTLDVSEVKTSVSYSSSTPSVATISPTGEITALKEGTTTITATAVENAAYKSAETSFTLTVTDSTPSLEISASKTTVSAAGETVTITVNTNQASWTAESSDPTNFAIGTISGNTVPVTVSAYDDFNKDRTEEITIKAGTLSKSITLTQTKKGATLTVTPTSKTWNSDDTTPAEFTVIANGDWSVTPSQNLDWAEVVKGDGIITVTPKDANTSSEAAREATLTVIHSGDNTKTVSINLTQKKSGGETKTYQHVFTEKPATGDNITLSGVKWNITATNLNGYNSQNYAGVQFGTGKANGEIKLTSPSAWSYTKDKVTVTTIKEVRLWLNLGGTSVTPTVTIGGVEAVSDGTKVVQNKGAKTDWTKATKVTFTPAADGNTGVIVIDVTSVKAGYICAVEIDAE